MSSTIGTQIYNANYGPNATARQLERAQRAGERPLGVSVATSSPAALPAATTGSTVSLSAAGLKLLQGLGTSVVDIAKGASGVATEAVELPIDVVQDVATGIGNATGDAGRMLHDVASGSVASLADDASAFAHDLFVTLPANLGADLTRDAKAGLVDASTLASGIVGLTSLGATGGATLLGPSA